uniref:Uncharacterized protein n=1 Tax=Anguilla anguilla TaxID=7936 RepID=A0A0E9SS75_ANGAN
MHYGMSVMVL